MSDFENEQWRTIGIAPEYQVSDHGRVRRRKLLRPMGGEKRGNKTRPLYVRLFPEVATYVNARIVDLVAAAFLSEPPPGHRADHKDGDRLNLHVSNIHYVTDHAYWLANKRCSNLTYLTKPKAVKPSRVIQNRIEKPAAPKPPTPEEAAMITALKARERRDEAEALADRIKRATILRERQQAKRLLEQAREEREAERAIARQIKEAERQETQARKEEAKRNTRPTISPRVWRGRHEEFAAIWSETPLTIDLRMDGADAVLIDRDGKTRRVQPGDLFAAYQGRIVRKAKAPRE